MITFNQPTPNGIIYAVKKNTDESTSIVATCNNTKDKNPSVGGSWDVRDSKMNQLSKLTFALALATAWSATWHCAVLRDLLEHHSEKLAIKD